MPYKYGTKDEVERLLEIAKNADDNTEKEKYFNLALRCAEELNGKNNAYAKKNYIALIEDHLQEFK